jgi:predicted enzyme related to lactoylglutathione lyase
MDMGEGGTYTILKSNGTDIGGMFKMKGPQFEGVPPHWMGYTRSMTATPRWPKSWAPAAPFDVLGIGRIAVITDPTGSAVSLMAPAPEQRS